MGLKSFMEENPQCIHLLFPSEKDVIISGEEMKDRILFQDDAPSESSRLTKDFFFQYIDLIGNRKKGIVLQVLCKSFVATQQLLSVCNHNW